MKHPAEGNGSGRFAVHQLDMGGWVRVFTERPSAAPADLPVYLAQALADWFRQRPHLLLQTVVPICRDGDTRELHGWYRVHLLPALQGPAPAEVE